MNAYIYTHYNKYAKCIIKFRTFFSVILKYPHLKLLEKVKKKKEIKKYSC